MSIDDYGDALDRSGRCIEELSKALAAERTRAEAAESRNAALEAALAEERGISASFSLAHDEAEAELEALQEAIARLADSIDPAAGNHVSADELRTLLGGTVGEGG